MPRKILERSVFYPYHICNRSLDKAFYPLDPQSIWVKACDLLCILSWFYDAKIHAFVLMSNHYHMLLSTPSENLDDCIQYFQSNLSRWFTEMTSKNAYAFRSRYKWSIIKDPHHYANVYRYIYQNPLRANLVASAEEYEFSTLRGKYGLSKLLCPVAPHEFDGQLPDTDGSEVEWINTTLGDEEITKIRFGLRRRVFTPPKRIRSLEKGVGRVAKGA